MKKGFSTKQRLRKRAEFQEVFAARQRVSGRYYVLNYHSNTVEYPRFGIVASKRNVPLSVARSRVKRLVREAFRHYQDRLGAIDLVFIVKAGSAERSKQELRQCLDKLLEQIIDGSSSSLRGL